MEDREVGISYTEFSYMLLQAFDYYVLCRDYIASCRSVGAQWGNITAGHGLCRKNWAGRRLADVAADYESDGTKYGNTEAGTVWPLIRSGPAHIGFTSLDSHGRPRDVIPI